MFTYCGHEATLNCTVPKGLNIELHSSKGSDDNWGATHRQNLFGSLDIGAARLQCPLVCFDKRYDSPTLSLRLSS